MSESPICPLALGDLDWVVESTRRRREALAPHAPRLWRPAPDATDRHRAYLGQLVQDPATLGVRSPHGYLLALDRGARHLVDDMVVADGYWATEGLALLRHAQERVGRLRLVVPAAETDRLDAARAAGLRPVETWWHRDLDGVALDPSAVDEVVVDGARGRLVPAPPVYAPGGPVLLVTDVADAGGLRAIEVAAALSGAPVSVVRQDPRDEPRAALLTSAGYVVTTHFCE